MGTRQDTTGRQEKSTLQIQNGEVLWKMDKTEDDIGTKTKEKEKIVLGYINVKQFVARILLNYLPGVVCPVWVSQFKEDVNQLQGVHGRANRKIRYSKTQMYEQTASQPREKVTGSVNSFQICNIIHIMLWKRFRKRVGRNSSSNQGLVKYSGNAFLQPVCKQLRHVHLKSQVRMESSQFQALKLFF